MVQIKGFYQLLRHFRHIQHIGEIAEQHLQERHLIGVRYVWIVADIHLFSTSLLLQRMLNYGIILHHNGMVCLLLLIGGNMKNNPLINAKNPWKGRKMFYIAYTGLFLLCICFAFSVFLFKGKSFVRASDGFYQHIKAFTYYGQYLRQLVQSLFVDHRLSLPEFSFSLGLGSDIITTLHYYAIGDPFNLLSAFVPSTYAVYLYSALVFVRLYLSGLCFSLFCYNKGLKNHYGILAGALMYAFNGFSLFAAGRHPYFINPVVFLPLLLMGVDLVLAKKRPYLLIVMVGIATASNFYFLYMLALLVIVYVIGAVIATYRHSIKELWKVLFRLVCYAVLGAALGAVLLLPILPTVLTDNRVSVEAASMLLYPRAYYSKFLASLISSDTPGYWTRGGFTAVGLMGVFLLFMKKKQWALTKIFTVLTFIALLLPIFGKISNGFSYVTNRWCFGAAFVVAFVLASVWSQLVDLTKKEVLVLGSCFTLYAIISFCAERSRLISFFSALAVGFAALALIILLADTPSGRIKQLGQKGLVALTLIGFLSNAFWLYSAQGSDYVSEFMDYKDVINKLTYTPDILVNSVSEDTDDESFFRYSGRSLYRNSSLLFGTHAAQYYWSLSNPYIADAQRELSMREPMSQLWDGLDDRSALMTLSSVRYYTLPEKAAVSLPYGVKKIAAMDINRPVVEDILQAQEAEFGRELSEQEINSLAKRFQKIYAIYENSYTLPLGYTYSNYLTREAYDKMTPLEKQEALLQTAVLEDSAETSLPQNDQVSFTGVEIPYTVKCSDQHVTQQGNSFVVTGANTTVDLILENAVAGETYLSLSGITFAGVSVKQLFNDDQAIDPLNIYTGTTWDTQTVEKQESLQSADRYYQSPTTLDLSIYATHTNNKKSVTKTLMYNAPNYTWYNARHDYDINLGYNENPAKVITITFPSVGTYSFESIKVMCQPMTNYADQVNALREDVLENVSFAADKVTGTISLDTPKLLCLSIPYSEGWEAYVNGEPAQILQTNTMYMGLDLPAGEHRIQLIYKTPGLRLGMAVSGIALVTFLGLIVIQEVCPRLKKQKKAKEV